MTRKRTESVGKEVHKIPGRFVLNPKWMLTPKDVGQHRWSSTVPMEEHKATKVEPRYAFICSKQCSIYITPVSLVKRMHYRLTLQNMGECNVGSENKPAIVQFRML